MPNYNINVQGTLYVVRCGTQLYASRFTDGGIGGGGIGEGGCEETIQCLILTQETFIFTASPAIAVVRYIFEDFRGVFSIYH